MIEKSFKDVDNIQRFAELTKDEEKRYFELVDVIEKNSKAFIEVGKALLEIRESRLYKHEFSRFEDFTQKYFGMGKNNVNQQIQASSFADKMTNKMVISNFTSALELRKYENDVNFDAIVAKCKELSGVWPVTSTIVKQAVEAVCGPKPGKVVDVKAMIVPVAESKNSKRVSEVKDSLAKLTPAKQIYDKLGVDPNAATAEDMVLVLWEMSAALLVKKVSKSK